jgi:hypothetical protein
VPARLFCRIQSFFSRLNKKLLLSLAVFIAAVFFVGVPVFADINSDYPTYLNLFNGTSFSANLSNGTQSPTFDQSGIFDPGTAGDLIQDASTKAVTGLKLNIALGFKSSDSSLLGPRWDHVGNTTINGGAFLVRVCDNLSTTNCWVNTIPYNPNLPSNSKILTASYISSTITKYAVKNLIEQNYYNNPIILLNFPLFTSDSTYGVPYKYARITTNNKDEGIISSFNGLTLPAPSSVQATFWYCANSVSGEKDGSQAYQGNGNGDTVATFGDLCGGDTYFRIGSPIIINVPVTASAVTAKVNTQQTTTATSSNSGNLPVCGLIPGPWTNGTINGCAAQIAYGIYNLTAWVAGLFGQLFDFFIGYSLSDVSYRYAFAVTGWQLVRDISNVFFILIMVWTGFSAVFNLEKANMKSIVATLIINAFLINFSLFFTRIIIDVSNVTARVFYNQMIVCPSSQVGLTGGCTTPLIGDVGGFPSLSTKIVSAFNPQKIFNPTVLKGFQDTNPDGTNNTGASFNAALAGNQDVINNSRDYADFFGIVSLIAAALMVAIAIMFFKVTFLFLGRVVGLYICMIFSPFAFLSKDLPMFGKIARLKWADWMGELTSLAIMAPLFVFYLYLIYTLLNSNFVQEIGIANNAAGGFFDSVLTIAIPLLIIYFLLQIAQKSAESLSGEVGKSVQKLGVGATGLALGAATGGTSFLGSQTLGRTANYITNSEKFKDWAANNGKFGKAALKSVDSFAKKSYDVRDTGIGKGFSKQFGINLDQKPLGFVGLDTKSSKGGYRQKQEDKVKADEEYKKLLVTKKSDDEIKATYTEEELKKRYSYDDAQDATLNNKWLIDESAKDSSFAEKYRDKPEDYGVNGKEWKAYKKKNKDDTYSKSKNAYQKNTPPPAVFLTAGERNKARTDAYADKMEKKSGGPFATQDYKNSKEDIVVRKGELLRNPYAGEKLTGVADGITYEKGKKIAKKNSWQAFAEMREGAAKGVLLGGAIGTAVLPVVGTLTGMVIGGFLAAIKQGLDYSGTTNKRIGGAFRTEPKKKEKILDDLAKIVKDEADEAAPAAPTPSAPAGSGGGTPPPTTP